MRAFEQLYREHSGPLYHRVIRQRTASSADAEDILTETFLAAWRHLTQFEHRPGRFFGWLATIARNRCIDRARASHRSAHGLAVISRHDKTPLPLPDSHVIAKSERGALRHAIELVLDELNPRYAEALRLRLLEDRPRSECAESLEVKVATFDVVLLRATRAFKKQWEKRYGQTDPLDGDALASLRPSPITPEEQS